MKESTEAVIELPDIKNSVFQELLEFIYTDKMDDLPLDNQDLVYLMMVANQFQLERLKEMTEKVLASSLDEDNVLSLWEVAGLHEAVQLKRLCLNFIMKNWKTVKSRGRKQGISIPQELKKKKKTFTFSPN